MGFGGVRGLGGLEVVGGGLGVLQARALRPVVGEFWHVQGRASSGSSNAAPYPVVTQATMPLSLFEGH